jgi:F0F1-type ATP synthase membrane subunit b/b'
MTSGNVLDAGALEVFKGALTQFGEEALETLQATQLEINRTYEWLERQKKDCEKKVYRCQQELEQARVQYVRNPNSLHEEAVLIAKRHLHEAEEEYKKVVHWSKQIQQTVAPYQVQAAKLSLSLRNDLLKATASLEKRIDFLKSSY